MVDREVSQKVLQFATQYPVITITGPRQSGKTTLCKMLFPEKGYINLENIEVRNYAASDPKQQFSVNDIMIFENHEKRDILFFVIGFIARN